MIWTSQQDEAVKDDVSYQWISVATKRKAVAEESESNVFHNQDDVLASTHRVGACNSLNKRARLDSSSNGGDTAHADEQMFDCHVYVIQADNSSLKIDIIRNLLSSRSTFADARQAILERTTRSLVLPAHEPWCFYVPPRGSVAESLESSLGPLRDFLWQTAPFTVTEQGNVRLFCLSTKARLDGSNVGDTAPADEITFTRSRPTSPA